MISYRAHRFRMLLVAVAVFGVSVALNGIASSPQRIRPADPRPAEPQRKVHAHERIGEPNPDNPNTIGFWNAKRGLIGTGDLYAKTGGTISLTTDGGKTVEVVARTESGVAYIDTAGTKDAWVATQGPGRPRQILHTDDGGQTWENVSKVRWSPSFATPTDGMALKSGYQNYEGAIEAKRVVITHDGGTSWSRVRSPCPARRYTGTRVAMGTPSEALAVCVQEGYTGIEPKQIRRTEDGGQSWQKLVDVRSCRKYTGICGLGFSEELVLDDSGAAALMSVDTPAYLSWDRGEQWSHRRNGAGPHSLSTLKAQPVSKRTVVALVGGYGLTRLLFSGDRGAHWQVRHKWPWRLGREK
jgi:photosystem II stability/assembly factor-like uncharacterized protein